MTADHGAAMDQVYRGQRHIYDLTRRFYLLGRDRLIRDLAPPTNGRVLEVGCGTGRNLIKAARAWPKAQFFGLDISAEMLKSAEASVASAGMTSRVALGRADATDFDPAALFGETGFDRIAYSYTLSMIPDWQGALRQGLALLAPGGELHLVDFYDHAKLPGWFARANMAWLAKFHVTPRVDLPEWLAAECTKSGMTVEVTPLYRRYAMIARVKRVV